MNNNCNCAQSGTTGLEPIIPDVLTVSGGLPISLSSGHALAYAGLE